MRTISPPRDLNLEHHYLADEMMERLTAGLPGVSVDLTGQVGEVCPRFRFAVEE